jgi:hypothetical protein
LFDLLLLIQGQLRDDIAISPVVLALVGIRNAIVCIAKFSLVAVVVDGEVAHLLRIDLHSCCFIAVACLEVLAEDQLRLVAVLPCQQISTCYREVMRVLTVHLHRLACSGEHGVAG